MNPILTGSIAAGALCALVAIARHLRRRNATQTLVYDIQRQRWVPADDYEFDS